MTKTYLNTVEDFKALPQEVQKNAFDYLGGYSEVCVILENGKYSYMNGACLKSEYAPDHKVLFFAKNDLRKDFAADIERVEARWNEETKNFDWEKCMV